MSSKSITDYYCYKVQIGFNDTALRFLGGNGLRTGTGDRHQTGKKPSSVEVIRRQYLQLSHVCEEKDEAEQQRHKLPDDHR